MFENPRRNRQARNLTTNVPKILDLKSSSEQIFSENWLWVPLSLTRYSRSLLYGHSLNTDNFLCFWRKKAWHIFSKFNPLNTYTFYGLLSVHINGVWLYYLFGRLAFSPIPLLSFRQRRRDNFERLSVELGWDQFSIFSASHRNPRTKLLDTSAFDLGGNSVPYWVNWYAVFSLTPGTLG